jgi:hypothetical protein
MRGEDANRPEVPRAGDAQPEDRAMQALPDARRIFNGT